MRLYTGGWRKGADWLRGCAMGWAVVARNAAQTAVDNAKLKATYGGGAATTDSPAPFDFFCPCIWQKNTEAGAQICLRKKKALYR